MKMFVLASLLATLPAWCEVYPHPSKPSSRPAAAPTKGVAKAEPPVAAESNLVYGDVLRIPFQENKIYKLKVVQGSPCLVVLPMGEHAEFGWCDTHRWIAQKAENERWAVIGAKEVEDVIGRQSFIHMTSLPSGIRISFAVECVTPNERVPGVVELIVDPHDAELGRRRAMANEIGARVAAMEGGIQADYQARFETWRNQALAGMTDKFKTSGSIPVDRVAADGIQTRIFVTTTEVPNLAFLNRDGKEEVVDSAWRNGVFIVNRVLAKGEAFLLTIGSKRTEIRLK